MIDKKYDPKNNTLFSKEYTFHQIIQNNIIRTNPTGAGFNEYNVFINIMFLLFTCCIRAHIIDVLVFRVK